MPEPQIIKINYFDLLLGKAPIPRYRKSQTYKPKASNKLLKKIGKKPSEVIITCQPQNQHNPSAK